MAVDEVGLVVVMGDSASQPGSAPTEDVQQHQARSYHPGE